MRFPWGPLDMGGPLFDLEGRLIGINIAKANRVNSLQFRLLISGQF